MGIATIQIRDIPDDAYELIHEQAVAAGQSLQAFMREQIVELAAGRAQKAEAIRRMEAFLEREEDLGLTPERLVAELHADRR